MALFLQRVQREGDVMRGQLRTVVETRLGSHREAIGELVGRNPHRFCGKAVHRVGLVVRARHQRIKTQLHALGALTLEDEGVERIEGLERLIVGPGRRDRGKQPSLRRVRIDVVEMVEVGRIFQIAEHRQPVRLGAVSGRGDAGAKLRGAERADAETEYVAAGQGGTREKSFKSVYLSWPLFRRRTTRAPEIRRRRISAADRDG